MRIYTGDGANDLDEQRTGRSRYVAGKPLTGPRDFDAGAIHARDRGAIGLGAARRRRHAAAPGLHRRRAGAGASGRVRRTIVLPRLSERPAHAAASHRALHRLGRLGRPALVSIAVKRSPSILSCSRYASISPRLTW